MGVASLTIAATAGDNNQTGRYQIVAADIDHSGTQTVFKIDTVTGQAWTYTEAYETASIERFWSSINERPSTSSYVIHVGRGQK